MGLGSQEYEYRCRKTLCFFIQVTFTGSGAEGEAYFVGDWISQVRGMTGKLWR